MPSEFSVNVEVDGIDLDDDQQRIVDLYADNIKTFIRKNMDYGNSFVRSAKVMCIYKHGEITPDKLVQEIAEQIFVRMQDKQSRTFEVVVDGNEREVENETGIETLLDWSNYAVMLASQLQKLDEDDFDLGNEEDSPFGDSPYLTLKDSGTIAEDVTALGEFVVESAGLLDTEPVTTNSTGSETNFTFGDVWSKEGHEPSFGVEDDVDEEEEEESEPLFEDSDAMFEAEYDGEAEEPAGQTLGGDVYDGVDTVDGDEATEFSKTNSGGFQDAEFEFEVEVKSGPFGESEEEEEDDSITVTVDDRNVSGWHEAKEDLGLNVAGDAAEGVTIVDESYDGQFIESVTLEFEDEDALANAKDRLYNKSTGRSEFGDYRGAEDVADFAGALPTQFELQ